MDNKQLEKYRSELVAEKQAKLDAVNSQYDKKLAALSVLIDDDQPELKIPKPATMILNGRAAANLMQATREAIRETSGLMGGMSGKFSTETLLTYIKGKYPTFAKKPSDLSGSLWRLKKEGEIEVVTEGVGRIPNIYQKTSNFDVTT
jgi:hypothetical protein